MTRGELYRSSEACVAGLLGAKRGFGVFDDVGIDDVNADAAHPLSVTYRNPRGARWDMVAFPKRK